MGKELNSVRYDELLSADKYLTTAGQSLYRPLYLAVLESVNSGEKVLELGCGTGQLGEMLVQRGVLGYIGIDFSGFGIEKSKERLSGYENVELLCLDVREVDYEKLDYDVVIATEVFEHISEDLKLLERLGRAKGKRIVFSVPNFDSEGHVRHFVTIEQARARYGEYVEIEKARVLVLGKCEIYLFEGRIRSEIKKGSITMEFRGVKYDDILNTLKERDEIYTFDETKYGIYIRHDIDSKFDSSFEMAKLEASKGVRSTYFVLHYLRKPKENYWEKPETWEKLRAMQAMGHHIGFHNAILTEIIEEEGLDKAEFDDRLNRLVKEKLNKYLGKMRDEGLMIRYTCGHGDQGCHSLKYANNMLWLSKKNKFVGLEQVNLKDYGLVEDIGKRTGSSIYVSDSSNRWNLIRFGGEGDFYKGYSMYKDQKEKPMHLLIHPEWWVIDRSLK